MLKIGKVLKCFHCFKIIPLHFTDLGTAALNLFLLQHELYWLGLFCPSGLERTLPIAWSSNHTPVGQNLASPSSLNLTVFLTHRTSSLEKTSVIT